MTNKTITLLGVFVLISYGLIKVLEFYGIGISNYSTYLAFYAFLLLSYLVLPTDYYKIKPS
jgi:hypothetical protein